MIIRNQILSIIFLSICMIGINSHAEVILHGTRVIFPSDSTETTLQISNEGTQPSLIQSWLDNGNPNSTPDEIQLPFVITPPIARIDPEKSQTLRILALPNSHELNQQHESLFWLNVLDIPPKPTSNISEDSRNFLQLAIRSRIKFIYRPSSIKENANSAPKKLNWRRQDNKIVIKNPTPFYITITSIFSKENRKIDITPQGILIAPYSEYRIENPKQLFSLRFITINDYGSPSEQDVNF